MDGEEGTARDRERGRQRQRHKREVEGLKLKVCPRPAQLLRNPTKERVFLPPAVVIRKTQTSFLKCTSTFAIFFKTQKLTIIKLASPAQRKENRTHSQEKNQSTETDQQMTSTLGSSHKDFNDDQ